MGCANAKTSVNVYRYDQSSLASHPAVDSLRAGGVVVLAGAGISCSAGVPDFRSPKTGLYSNLKKYKLPSPQSIFELEYFRQVPEAFTSLAKEIWPTDPNPTPAHCFVRLLHDKGLLLRHYTQNVDGLDRAAGISEEKLVEAHGSFGAGHCIDCQAAYTEEYIRERVFKGTVARCTVCSGLVKPDIVFFGEPLPRRFTELAKSDFKSAKVVLCMGTSLSVQPFASLAKKRNSPDASRILVNRAVPASYKQCEDDLVLLGDCDDKIWELAACLGWRQELEELVRKSWPAARCYGDHRRLSTHSGSSKDGDDKNWNLRDSGLATKAAPVKVSSDMSDTSDTATQTTQQLSDSSDAGDTSLTPGTPGTATPGTPSSIARQFGFRTWGKEVSL